MSESIYLKATARIKMMLQNNLLAYFSAWMTLSNINICELLRNNLKISGS